MNTDRPRVTIIVPNYQHEAYLAERLASIEAQTYQDYELILLDDCSQDGSAQMLRDFAASRDQVTLLMNDENSGSTFKQWKKGLELAKGELIWIAESDDRCSAQLLETAVRAYDEESDLCLHYCQSTMIDGEGQPMRDNIIWTEDLDSDLWASDHLMAGREYISRFLWLKNVIPNASAVVFKRAIGLRHIDRILDYRMAGDWLYWALLAAEGEVAYSAARDNDFRSIPGTTRDHHSLERKRRRIIEEADVMTALLGRDLLSVSQYHTVCERLLDAWSRLHGFWNILDGKTYEVIDHLDIDMSRSELLREFILKTRHR